MTFGMTTPDGKWFVQAGMMVTLTLACLVTPAAYAQVPAGSDGQASEEKQAALEEPVDETAPSAPQKVNVEQVVGDPDIAIRLRNILAATDWFEQPDVEVENGVVFIKGTTSNEKYREWASKVAEKTEDVVAVVNRIRVTRPPIWDLTSTWSELQELGRSTVQSIPLIILAILTFGVTWLVMKLLLIIADRTVLKRFENNLLREVARKALAIPVLLFGFYLMLRISGMTRLAMTVIGGTGLIGLVIGFAFRDIAENFLASILLSMQNPFRYGDLIEVNGDLGFVQRVNTRGTLLMTLEGNHIQIPNSTIYKETIKNFSANSNCRFDFIVGVGYEVPVTRAQETAMQILSDHPAVLDDPEPQVLVEKLGASTVDLRVYAWVNAEKHSWIKVRSSLIRLVKSGFEQQGFEMPDDQREMIFPNGVPVIMQQDSSNGTNPSAPSTGRSIGKTNREIDTEHEHVTNAAEGDLESEVETVKQQARQSRDPDEGSTDLLESEHNKKSSKSEKPLSESPEQTSIAI